MANIFDKKERERGMAALSPSIYLAGLFTFSPLRSPNCPVLPLLEISGEEKITH